MSNCNYDTFIAWVLPTATLSIFLENSVAKFVLNLSLKFATFLVTIGVTLDRSLHRVRQGRYGVKKWNKILKKIRNKGLSMLILHKNFGKLNFKNKVCFLKECFQKFKGKNSTASSGFLTKLNFPICLPCLACLTSPRFFVQFGPQKTLSGES